VATPTSFSNQTLDFIRLATQDIATCPQAGLAIYPQNSKDTVLSINVSTTAVNIKYIASTILTQSIPYIGKSLEELATEINSLTIPIKAVPTLRNYILSSGDLFLYDSVSYFQVPDGFRILDRTTNDGVLIRTNKFTVSHKKLTNFSLKRPYNTSLSYPWYPVISNGEFTYRYNGNLYRFKIPEFDKQVWSIKYGKPFKDVINGALKLLKNNAYKVERTPIFWSGENIKIYNSDSLVPNSLIEDIDVNNGIIYFKPNNVITEETQIDYTYLEENYEYTGININGHTTQNPSVLDKFVVIYALPAEGVNYLANNKTIYHVISDSVEEAVASIEKDNYNNPVVVVGAYCIQQVYTSDRISILDTRTLGGGLVDPEGPKSPVHKIAKILNKKKETPIENSLVEAGSFFDIGTYDGKAYPGAGSVAMEMPDSVKDLLPESDLKLRATKFLAAGIYPVMSFYKTPLPAVSGLSTQISCFFNGGIIDSKNLATGTFWFRSPVSIPGTATGNWNTSTDNLLVPASKLDGTGVISTNPSHGAYQTYLKSTPVAGIEYYKRTYTVSKNSNHDEKHYSPWERVVLNDTREVATGQLIKGYVSFPESMNNVEYRSVTVNSPYRLDFTGRFKTDVASEIYNIHNAISGRTDSVTTYGTVIYPVLHASVSDDATMPRYDSYAGTPKPLDYVGDIVQTDLSSTYSGFYTRIGDYISVALGFDDNSFSGMFRFFDQNSLTYRELYESASGIDATSILECVNNYGAYRKNLFGTGDYYYTNIKAKMPALVWKHTVSVGDTNYLPATYNYSVDAGIYTVSGKLHRIPEVSGYSSAEVYEENNTDFEYLKSAQGIISSVELVENFTGSYAQSIRPYIQAVWSGVSTAMDRMPDAINGTRTINGNEVVQHWYMPYNRYGRYAGSLVNQLINCYEHLKNAQTTTGGLTWSSTPGLDVKTLASGFRYIEDTLYTAYPGFSETIARGGMLDEYTSDLLYGYGWYSVNKTAHDTIVSTYNPLLNGVVVNDYRSIFSGLFSTGLRVLVKGMTTINGDILETVIVDGDQGPFNPSTPSRIFNTLGIACQLNKREFLPLAQAVFNTVKNNYGAGGYYYLDPLKSTADMGAEESIIRPLVKLYKSIQ